MTQTEALRLALEALNSVLANHKGAPVLPWIEARDAIKAALEAKDEPVAWSHAGVMPPEQEEMKEAAYRLAPWLSAALDDPKVCQEYKNDINAWFDAAMPAPQRTWVGLTNEEIDALHKVVKIRLMGTYDTKDIYRAIEAKLKEKNT